MYQHFVNILQSGNENGGSKIVVTTEVSLLFGCTPDLLEGIRFCLPDVAIVRPTERAEEELPILAELFAYIMKVKVVSERTP